LIDKKLQKKKKKKGGLHTNLIFIKSPLTQRLLEDIRINYSYKKKSIVINADCLITLQCRLSLMSCFH